MESITFFYHHLGGLGNLLIISLTNLCPWRLVSGLDGADEHPSIVADLLQEEIQEGWIEEIAGGEEELKMKFPHAAMGNSPWCWHLIVLHAW